MPQNIPAELTFTDCYRMVPAYKEDDYSKIISNNTLATI
jgi:hypothetical protein